MGDQSAYMPALEQKKEAPKGYADTYGQCKKPDKYKKEEYFMPREDKPEEKK